MSETAINFCIVFRCKEVEPLQTLCAHFVAENVDESETKKMKLDFEQAQDLNLEFDVLIIHLNPYFISLIFRI